MGLTEDRKIAVAWMSDEDCTTKHFGHSKLDNRDELTKNMQLINDDPYQIQVLANQSFDHSAQPSCPAETIDPKPPSCLKRLKKSLLLKLKAIVSQ